MKLCQGDIVLVPFPFSDLSSVKTRPALVVSNGTLKGDDVILCAITSQKSSIHEVQIYNKNLLRGSLPFTSYIRANKIVSLKKTIIRKIVARISKEKSLEVHQILIKLIEPSK